jgi:Putative prokaryotic signal transducing protein
MNSNLPSLRTFSFRPEAERAQQILEAAGIPSVVSGGDASGWAPHIGFATGGITLSVDRADHEQARKLLEELDD